MAFGGDINFQNLDQILHDYKGCHNLRSDSITPWLEIFDSFTYVVAWSTVTVNFVYRDIFHAYVAVVLVLNYLGCWLLNWLIQSPPLVGIHCIYTYQLPCYLIEVTFVFFVMYAWLLIMQRHRMSDLWWSILYIYLFVYCMILERIYRGINSPLQLWASALIGFGAGTVAVGFMYVVVRPYSRQINGFWLIRWLKLKNEYFNYEGPSGTPVGHGARSFLINEAGILTIPGSMMDCDGRDCQCRPEQCLKFLTDKGRNQVDVMIICILQMLAAAQRCQNNGNGLMTETQQSDMAAIDCWLLHVFKHAQAQTESTTDIYGLAQWMTGYNTEQMATRAAQTACALYNETKGQLMPNEPVFTPLTSTGASNVVGITTFGGSGNNSQQQQQQQYQLANNSSGFDIYSLLPNSSAPSGNYAVPDPQQQASGDVFLRATNSHPSAMLNQNLMYQ